MCDCVVCAANELCPYYAEGVEVSIESCGEIIENYIESQRDDYRSAWISYVSTYDDETIDFKRLEE